MALLNIGTDDPNLRLAAYNLLYALSMTFHFDVGKQLLDAKGEKGYARRERESDRLIFNYQKISVFQPTAQPLS